MRILIIVIICAVSSLPMAFAHTTVSAGQYDIEVGWGLEPPVVGIWNTFVFHVTEPGAQEGVKTGVINAFKDMRATATFGGVTKTLEINSDSRPGYYFANVIPTRTGSFSVLLEGEILGTTVDIPVPIEDVEATSLLDFPPSGGASDQDIESLKSAVAFMQAQIDDLEGMSTPASTGGASYDVAIMGLSLGAAAVILSVLAMVRHPKTK